MNKKKAYGENLCTKAYAEDCEPCEDGTKSNKNFDTVKTNYPNGLSGVTRVYSHLLEPMAKYIITKFVKTNPPRMASGKGFDKRIGYTDIEVGVNTNEPAIEGLTAIYDDKIITATQDYSGFIVTCYANEREQAKEWMEDFEHRMKTQNQYRGKNLFATDGTIIFRDIPKVAWDDVVLADKIKKDIRLNTVSFLGDKKLAMAGVTKRGLIMFGPPGTGKTSVVKSIFRELEGKQVSRIYVTAESFRRGSVSQLFDLVEYLGPTCLCFEDIDMIGTSRDIIASSSGPLGDLLTNLDGMRKYNDPIVIIASTNRIEMLDEALGSRPGRFDRKISIGLPTAELIKKLYAKFLGSEVSDEIVKMSSGFTGSHIYETVNTAKILGSSENKLAKDCIIEACNIVKENFFPGQTTDQIKVAAKKSLMKLSNRKGIIKISSKISSKKYEQIIQLLSKK